LRHSVCVGEPTALPGRRAESVGVQWEGIGREEKEEGRGPRAGSDAVSKWVICACDSLVDFGAV